jgi:6-phosphogluconolactonase
VSQETLIAKSEDEHASLGAELLARAITSAIEARGVARVALSGGTTPSPTYRKLAALALPFEKIEWWWVDERAVPLDNARSNFSTAARDLGASGERGRLLRMPADEADLEAAARAYERSLRAAFGVASAVSFDAMTLGIGDDGHTASLFPGLGVAKIDDRLVIAVPEQPTKKLEARLSLSAPVLRAASVVVVLARGANKRAPIAMARAEGSIDEVPSRVLQGATGRVVWLLDEAAAG